MTICNQWAWKPNDDMKTLTQRLQTLIRTAGGNGNLLFNRVTSPEHVEDQSDDHDLPIIIMGKSPRMSFLTLRGFYGPVTRKRMKRFVATGGVSQALTATGLPAPDSVTFVAPFHDPA